MRRLLCFLFGHHRDSRRVSPSYNGWRAPCMLCGARLVRGSAGRWREVLNEELRTSLAPYASVPRQPFFSSSSAGAHDLGNERETSEGGAGEETGGSDLGQPHKIDEGDRIHRLLRDLLEQSPLVEQLFEPVDERRTAAPARPWYQRVDQAGATSGDRSHLEPLGEAEMFALACACYREMLVRMADRASLHDTATCRSDETPTAQR